MKSRGNHHGAIEPASRNWEASKTAYRPGHFSMVNHWGSEDHHAWDGLELLMVLISCWPGSSLSPKFELFPTKLWRTS